MQCLELVVAGNLVGTYNYSDGSQLDRWHFLHMHQSRHQSKYNQVCCMLGLWDSPHL